jgi:hypothetical protein
LDRHDYTGFMVRGLVGEDLRTLPSRFDESQYAIAVALS